MNEDCNKKNKIVSFSRVKYSDVNSPFVVVAPNGCIFFQPFHPFLNSITAFPLR